MINPGEGRVKRDTDSALCNTAQRGGWGGGGGRRRTALEGESESRVFFACFEMSLSLAVAHTLGPCAAATSRAAAESIGAREPACKREREREGREGLEEEGESEAGGERREIKRERGSRRDYRENKHRGRSKRGKALG